MLTLKIHVKEKVLWYYGIFPNVLKFRQILKLYEKRSLWE